MPFINIYFAFEMAIYFLPVFFMTAMICFLLTLTHCSLHLFYACLFFHLTFHLTLHLFIHMIRPFGMLISVFSIGPLLALWAANECGRMCHAVALTHMYVIVSEPIIEEIKSLHIGIFFIYIIFACHPRKFCSIKQKKKV